MTLRATPEEIRRDIKTLKESDDFHEIGVAAIALAGAEDRYALAALGELLSSQAGLARLDDLSDPTLDTQRLFQVFQTLADHPTEDSGRLCEVLFADAEFRSVPERLNMVLAALAAVVPTSPRGAEIFRASIGEGYAEVVAPILLRNASPLALDVFEELIRGEQVEAYIKIDMLHRALLPTRYLLPVLDMCSRLLDTSLPAEVREGLIETLFDYQSRRWFGPAMNPPKPLPWEFATTESLRFLVSLANRLLDQPLADRLQAAVRATLGEVGTLLGAPA